MIADLIGKGDDEAPEVRPHPKMTIHTIMGDMRRWYEYDMFYSDYKVDKQKYEVLKNFYDQVLDFMCDVNPNEINAQIESGNLDNWCRIWREALEKKIGRIDNGK